MSVDPLAVSWDYESAYPGGPMVAVLGFPRPLYPPDNASQPDPVNGSDVEAYKRTISRLGRWQWQTFDQAYSNAFSHGKSGNVGDSGVEGFQRQMKIQPTGSIGKETFNALRSAKIPIGLPNAGQYGMDARSVELINAAYNRFKGSEPSGTPSTSSAQARLNKAKAEVGKKESPAYSNMQQYGAWYGMNGVPWCAIFCTWCDQLSTNPSKSFVKGSRYHYVPYIVSDARLGRNGLSLTSYPSPGDMVCFDWGRDGEYDHVGLVLTKPDGRGTFETVEGNTSTSDNSNGGTVMQRFRNRTGQNTLFVRVAE
jgi:peptidoglycan hydrolase-like protein with peptidoglycan-binding domain